MQPVISNSDRFVPARHFRGLLIAGLAAGAILISGASVGAAQKPAAYDDLPVRRWSQEEIRDLPDGPERIAREQYRQGEYGRRWNFIHHLVGEQHMSSKSGDILRGRGLGQARLDKNSGDPSLRSGAQAGQDTLRVLIVRMAFETNRDPNLTTIVPSGDFMLDPLADPLPLEVDPPPHNKAYFESHLQGLSEYYRFMSGGRLHIEGKVLPDDMDGSYKLSDVADYGPGAEGFWTLESLERLVQDMITKADQETQADGSANLADYDDNTPFTYIIFVHAGSDWQSDVNGDSPNDIPTFFVRLGEPVDLAGTDPEGLPGQLSECSIIPETTNQDGFPGSIAAAFYHEFGHALGLPDVYSTSTGLPSVGIWDLMDSGTNLPVTMGTVVAPGDTFVISATGVLPPSLSAWNKWFLGWLEMGELDGREGDYLLPAVGIPTEEYYMYPEFQVLPDNTQAFRAGLSPREWFLLENRWVPASVSQTPYNDLRFERDEETGVILYLAGQRQNTWRNSGLYDYFMPPGGILVWHVNSDRINEGLADNSINSNEDGLKLVEADGIQDIGVLEAYVRGWYGSYLDPFGGTDPQGNPTGFTNLYVEGFPSSRAFDRSWTGFSLSEVGPRTKFTDSVMKFKAGQGPVGSGFPYEIPPVQIGEIPGYDYLPSPRAIDTSSLTPVVLADGKKQVLIFADAAPADWTGGDYPATLFGRWADGIRRWVSLPGKPEGAFQYLGAPLSGPPFVADRADADGVDLVWGTTAGRVGRTHLPEFDMPAALWTVQVGDTLSGPPLPLTWAGSDGRVLCRVSSGELILLDGDGNTLGAPLQLAGSALMMAGPVSGAGGSDLAAALTLDGWFLVKQGVDGLMSNPAFNVYPRPVAGSIGWTATVPTLNGVQLHVFDDEGELGAWSVAPDGTVKDLGSPLAVPGPLVASPGVADLDGDGADDLVMLTASHIYAMRPDGVALRGFPVRFFDLFPLPDTTAVAGPVVVADATGDGVNELYFNTDGGHLLGLDATGQLMPRTPLRWGGHGTAGLAVGGPADARTLWLVSPGGYSGPPLGRQFVDGRVIPYGIAKGAAASARTSEWAGLMGGSARRGPEGTAQNLGPASPVAAEKGQVVFYPNPVSGDMVTVRFYSDGESAAQLTIYNLEGEPVASASIPVTSGTVNEYSLPLPGVASGLYLARLQYDAPGGATIKTLTLAVEK